MNNVFDYFLISLEQSKEKTAIYWRDEEISYSELNHNVLSCVAFLESLSIKKGDSIVIALGNNPLFCYLFYAAAIMGVRVLPFSTKYKQYEGSPIIGIFKPEVIFYLEDKQQWLGEYPCENNISKFQLQKAIEKNKPVDKQQLQQYLDNSNLDDPLVVMFTSGTTGLPKGASITHKNLIAAVEAYVDALPLNQDDIALLSVPIFHITGLSAIFLYFMRLGGSIVLHNKYSPLLISQDCLRHNVTFFHGSPTVFILLCKDLEVRGNTIPSLKHIACGAGSLNEGVQEKIIHLLPNAEIHTIYGLTETSSPATVYRGDVRNSNRTNSSGTAVKGMEIMISDPNGETLPANEIGTIWLNGDMVVSSYINTESTAFNNGWFNTGDLGCLDEEGYLYIKDRQKDLINRGGEKIYSIDVERIISSCLGVREVAVIPLKHNIYGEVPVAVVVSEESSYITAKEILDYLEGKIASYKMPEKIVFYSDLPRTLNGKINKRTLALEINESFSN